MIHQYIHRYLAIGVVAISLLLCPLALAEGFRESQFFPGRWSLNPAGQLQLWFDPLNNGHDEFEETYTVVFSDHAPKMCGDPDGTGRHTWFFTDALLIEVAPVRSQATPIYPDTQDHKELPR